MLFQDYVQTTDWIMIFRPFLSIFILIVLMVLMIGMYKYFRIWWIILVVFLFSLIIGGLSISVGDIPFSPYFQIFFIIFQSVFFIIMTMKVFKV